MQLGVCKMFRRSTKSSADFCQLLRASLSANPMFSSRRETYLRSTLTGALLNLVIAYKFRYVFLTKVYNKWLWKLFLGEQN